MMNKIGIIYDKVSYYVFNIIILIYLVNVYQSKSIKDLLILGASLLAIVGSLSGLCYTGASNITNNDDRKTFQMAGHRLLHTFLMIIFAFVFIASSIHLELNGLFTIKNKIIIGVLTKILYLFIILSLVAAARSFSMGFHMVKQILNFWFPLRDETLFDDLNKDEEESD